MDKAENKFKLLRQDSSKIHIIVEILLLQDWQYVTAFSKQIETFLFTLKLYL